MTLFLVLETQPHAQSAYAGLFRTAKLAQAFIDKLKVDDEDAWMYYYIEAVELPDGAGQANEPGQLPPVDALPPTLIRRNW